MEIALDQLIFYMCILVRITGFIYVAPFFSLKSVPQKVKIGLSILLAFMIYQLIPYEPLSYVGVIGFASLALKEVIVGLIMGLFANICVQILTFAGSLIDMEMGFSMVQEFDPISSNQVTITSNLYQYAILLMMLVMNLHHYIVKALVDSYQVIPVGKVFVHINIYQAMLDFIIDYFIIGFRIVLPMFAAMLIVNTVLAILAKVAPQMNMFVIGLQLKVLVGLLVLLFMVIMIPTVTDFIFTNMMEMLKTAVTYLKG